MIKFPDDFYWGSATSGPQTEGAALSSGKTANVWDYWSKKESNRFHKAGNIDDACEFYDNYKQDIQYLKETGHNSFRTSLQWSRLIPDDSGNVNQEAVEFYNNVIDELIAQGIEPFINLYHFDLPLYLYEKGGWESRETAYAFQHYAKTCFELFGDRVKKWFTFNEPLVPAWAGYFHGHHFPGLQDGKRGIVVGHYTMLASALAVDGYRSLNLDGEIGIILDASYVYPRSEHPADKKAAFEADLLINRFMLDPSVKGEYPKELITLLEKHDALPADMKKDSEIIRKGKVDWIGLNYYQPIRVKAPLYKPNTDGPFGFHYLFDDYDMPNKVINPHRGWEIYPQGIYDQLINLRDNYGNIRCFISENGMGVENEENFIVDGIIQDDYRIDFIKDHLKLVHKAIENGVNCEGYHLWTFIDCWSWCNSFKNRYGFVQFDLESRKKIVKKSGKWFKQVSIDNGF